MVGACLDGAWYSREDLMATIYPLVPVCATLEGSGWVQRSALGRRQRVGVKGAERKLLIMRNHRSLGRLAAIGVMATVMSTVAVASPVLAGPVARALIPVPATPYPPGPSRRAVPSQGRQARPR